MNIINAVAMNVSAMLNFLGYPQKSTYNSIEVYGGNIYDYVQVKNVELTEAEMLAIPLYINPIWDGNTLALALFENSASAGNISNLVNPITNWIIQRKKTTDTTFTTLAVVPATTASFLDLTAESNIDYIYQVFAVNDIEISDPLVNTLNSQFYNHLLIDTVTKVCIVFDLNLEFDGYEPETAFQRYDGYNKYSGYSIGERNFKTGSASAIVSESITVDNNIVQTVDYLKVVDEFLNNKNNKIMKDRKGNVMLVKTLGGMKQTPLNVGIGQQPYVVSFNFEEVGEVDA